MPQKQKAKQLFFYKTHGQPQYHGGADLAFDEGCQEIRDRYGGRVFKK